MKKTHMIFLCLCLIFGANILTPKVEGLRVALDLEQYQSLAEDAEKLSGDTLSFCKSRYNSLLKFLSYTEIFYNCCSDILKKLNIFLPYELSCAERHWLFLATGGDEMAERIKSLIVIYWYMCFYDNDLARDLEDSCGGYIYMTRYIEKFEKKGRL